MQIATWLPIIAATFAEWFEAQRQIQFETRIVLLGMVNRNIEWEASMEKVKGQIEYFGDATKAYRQLITWKKG